MHIVPVTNKHFFDLNPLDLGWEDCAPGHRFGPYIRNYYLIHYVKGGKGFFHQGGKTYPVEKGEFFLIRPGEVTQYEADFKDPWQYIWIGFDGAQAKRLDAISSPVQKISGHVFFEMMACGEKGALIEEFLASKLFYLFSMLFAKEKKPQTHLQTAIDYISIHYMKPLSVESLAAMLHLNRGYLFRLFKEGTGLSIQQFIQGVRMDKAALFLKEGFSVSQAAYMSGYSDPFHFSKMFKKHYGISPKSFYHKA